MPSTELAVAEPQVFAVAFPADWQRAATLTEIWLRRYRPHTRVNYARDLRQWLEWCHACKITAAQARIAHVDMWIERQRADGAAQSSIARRVSSVSSWYSYMIANTAEDRVPLATRNPAVGSAKPVVDPDYSPTLGLTGAEAGRLIAAADGEGTMEAALIRLLLVDGLRIGSALDAQITDLAYDRGHRTLTLTVKGGTNRRVAIPPMVGEAIDRMLSERGNPATGPLFVTRRGRAVYPLMAWRLVRRLAARARIVQAASISPHSLRATAITEFMDAGGSLRDAQDFAGHKDPRTTRRYDKNRHSLDRHGSYVLAGRYSRHDPDDG